MAVSESVSVLEGRARPGTARTPAVFGMVAVSLAAFTLVVAWSPGLDAHGTAPALDLVLDTIGTVILGCGATLGWIRYRAGREPVALGHAAAFTVLALAYASAVLVTLQNAPAAVLGLSTGGLQDTVFAIGRVGAGALLLVGCALALRRAGRTVSSAALTVVAVGTAATTLAALAAGPPSLVQVTLVEPPHITFIGAVVQLVAAALFFCAAFGTLRLLRDAPTIVDAWIAVGLVFAGYAEVHGALFPASHPGQTSSADVLRLAFFTLLIVGIEAEARAMLTRLRVANDEVARLHEADVDRAAADERARLARELHDGLAQDLWLAKLKAAELATAGALPASLRGLAVEATRAVDVGLTDARQALIALRLVDDAGSGFFELLQRFVHDFEDRFGLRVEMRCTGDDTVLAPRTQAELLRIVQEALTNVRQHADASIVGLRVLVRGGRVHVRVVDNGRGFDVVGARPSSFGLRAMRERAALIQARLRVASRPGDGTRITLSAPVAPSTATVGRTAVA